MAPLPAGDMRALKLLLSSRAFPPSVGGLEFMAGMLAEELSSLGCDVTVVTTTPGSCESISYELFRGLPLSRLLRLGRAADAVLSINVSLKSLLPFVIVSRPLIISHQTYYGTPDGMREWRHALKYAVAKRATNIACSDAIARTLPPGTVAIPNAYDDRIFQPRPGPRANELIFVGQLVSDKGADLLLESLILLGQEGRAPALTVVGAGPEEAKLREYSRRHGLTVTFEGSLGAARIADLLNSHRVQVVPSRIEPFGIVALEGLGCGCTVVASDAGGLPQAVGACGVMFRSGDTRDLAAKLASALARGPSVDRAEQERHVSGYSRRQIARRYLDVVESTVARRMGP